MHMKTDLLESLGRLISEMTVMKARGAAEVLKMTAFTEIPTSKA